MVIIGDEIISGFIGEAISRCVDFSWTKIKEAVKNRKNKHQNIESQIYNVVVNVLNQLTYNKFENDQDKIYQAAEKLLIGYKDSRCDSIEVVKFGLQILGENVNDNKYIQFKTLLYQELSKADYDELYRQIRLFQQDEESSKASRIEQKIDKVQQSADETNRRLDAFQENNKGKDSIQNRKPVKSRTQEYANKWNANMFLNDFDKRDENAGVNVKLREVYLEKHLPHYIWYKNTENNPSSDLKELLSDYINEKRDSKMLLVFGQPGIGKSTLITWITVNFANRINDILVYRFASDLGNTDWKNGNISNRVLEELGLCHRDLDRKVLILDGFDEVNIEVNRRRDILDGLYIDLVYNKAIENFLLIITCRENYVSQFAILKCKYITLQPWDEVQIQSFCNIFQEKTRNIISNNTIKKLLENKEILGIPLILYMVLALSISIEKEGSIVDVYDKIFSLEGGIYDRCIDNRNFADKHRIGVVKKQIHQISRDIAIWMFENKSEEAYIPQEEYRKICRNVMKKQQKNKDVEQDFLIGNFFKLVRHCEGVETEELYFVHRSIYEYFVAETILSLIEKPIMQLTGVSQEDLAKNITFYLKEGIISPTIGEYLQYRLIKLYNKMGNENKQKFYPWWENTVNRMMETGMFYYTDKNIHNYKNIISKEVRVFINLIQILRLLSSTNRKKYIMEKTDRELLERYIRYCEIESNIKPGKKILNLNNMCLSNLNLKYINLAGTEMAKVSLNKTDLSKADLSMVNLAEADFKGAYLNETDFRGADLSMADLRGIDLTLVKLDGANMSKTKLNASIWTKNTIKKTIERLREASFDYLLVRENDGLSIVYKNELLCDNLFS